MLLTFVFLTKSYFHLSFSEHSILCFIIFWLHNFDDKSVIALTYVPLYTHICNVGDLAAPSGAKIGIVCMCVKNHALFCQKDIKEDIHTVHRQECNISVVLKLHGRGSKNLLGGVQK